MRDTEFRDNAYRYKSGFTKKFIFIPFLALGAFALISYIVMLLWNNLLPGILHASIITYWQAMGLLILSKILFGFGGRGGRGSWMRHKMDRFKNMNPEEQERFRDEMRSRCGQWGKSSKNAEDTVENTSKPTE